MRSRGFQKTKGGNRPKREQKKDRNANLQRRENRIEDKKKSFRRSKLRKNQHEFEQSLIQSLETSENITPSKKPASSQNRNSIDRNSSKQNPTDYNKKPRNPKESIEGRVDVHPDGFGFLIPKDPKYPNIYLPEETLKYVMHRDQVLVNITDEYASGAKLRGQVVRITNRFQKEFIGAIRFFKGGALCIPLDNRNRKFAFRIENLPDHFKELKPGSAVLCKIINFPDTTPPTAEILDKIEDPDSASQDTLKIILSASWPRFFTKEATLEAEKRALEWRAELTQEKDRKDIRELPLVTIDGRDARDFDDAICAKIEGNMVRLWVAIADVSHFVRVGTALDKEAYARATSVYFPDHVIPMLPEVLSNGVCSLNPFEERACMVSEILIDTKGLVKEYKIYKGLMQSKRRLTYEQMQAYIEGESWAQSELHSLEESLKACVEVYRRLLVARKERGSIDLDIPEPFISLSKEGEVLDIQARVRLDSHKLIEECMLVANQCTAHFIFDHKEEGLYRIHEEPDSRKIQDLMNFLTVSGLNLNNLFKNLQKRKKKGQDNFTPFTHPRDFQQLLKFVQEELEPGSPVLKAINILTLRSMKQARYAPIRVGHFALATQDYTHFTSPIRRYPDLIIHRMLKEALNKDRGVIHSVLEAQGQHCSDQERSAMDMERKLIETKKCRYLEHHLGEEFDAWVSGITEKGLFCQIDGHFVDGLLGADNIFEESDHRFDPAAMCYIGPGKSKLSLGTRLRIQVAKVDVENRKIDFHLIKIYETLHN